MGDWIGIVATLAATLAAGAAFVQASQARRARADAQAAGRETAKLAAEANSAWNRIADAQETVAHAHRPKAWGPLKGGSGDLWVIRNTSERPITLHRIEVTPAEAHPLLEVDGDLPQRSKRASSSNCGPELDWDWVSVGSLSSGASLTRTGLLTPRRAR